MSYDERMRMCDVVETMRFAIRNLYENPDESIMKLAEIMAELDGMSHPQAKAA